MDNSALLTLIERYKQDKDSVYNLWFLSSTDRMKAFRAIRRGIQEVVQSITAGSFGNDFKGSSLEVVLAAITEQREIFEGAAHAFYWKPKLRIPDIYENESNKKKFALALHNWLSASRPSQVLETMKELADAEIKGLGPAVANIVYFLHPTIAPPFNTAIVRGFNDLFGTKMKLGCWDSYLSMQSSIQQTNERLITYLSKDLGALTGLFYEVGTGRYVTNASAEAFLKKTPKRKSVSRESRAAHDQEEAIEHTHIQHSLITLGRRLHYDVHVARNDRNRSHAGESFAHLTLSQLPELDLPQEVQETIGLIDVLWILPGTNKIVSAFEVEKSTSIYSGILRLVDLANSLPSGSICDLFLVIPTLRENEVRAQFLRPALCRQMQATPVRFFTFTDLCQNCEAMGKFGKDHSVLAKIVR